MTTPLTYPQSFQVIKSACQTKIDFFDAILKQLNSFINSNQTLLKNLSKIKLDLPDKRSTGLKTLTSSLFKGVKGPTEFKGTEKLFLSNFNSIANQILSNPPGLELEMQLLSGVFIPSFTSVTNTYSAKVKKMIKLGEEAEQQKLKKEQEYNKEIQKRDQIVADLESLKKKSEEDNPTLPQKRGQLATQLQLQEKLIQDLLPSFNESQLNYAKAMERVFTLFEDNDKELNESLNNAFKEFSQSFVDVKLKKDAAVSFMSGLGQKEELEAEMKQSTQPGTLSHQNPEILTSKIKPLQFSVSEFLHDTSFEDEYSKTYAIATIDYDAKLPNEVSLKSGERVLVHHSLNGKALVQINELCGYVPLTVLQGSQNAVKPHQSVIKSDYKTDSYKFKKGQCVFVRDTSDGMAYIVSEDFQKHTIPADLVA